MSGKGSLLLSAAANVGPNEIGKNQEVVSNTPVYNDNSPFQNFRATGKYFTDFRSAGLLNSNLLARSRTQLQNNNFRGFMSRAGGPTQSTTNSVVGNQQKNYGVTGSDLTCNADIDCNYSAGFKGTCNVAHQGWNEFNKGYQNSGYCYFNIPIEFKGGKYFRRATNLTGKHKGGIGQTCTTHGQCGGDGWYCRGSDEPGEAHNGLPLPPAYNEFGSGNQVGYCAQVQTTATETGPKNYWIEYGNHSKPDVPPANQNGGQNGNGYSTYDEANAALMPGQSIFKRGDRWFCTYPIKAPFPANLRQSTGSQLAPLSQTQASPAEIKKSIQLQPLYAKDRPSTGMGGGGRGGW